jgi:hypothetical protein
MWVFLLTGLAVMLSGAGEARAAPATKDLDALWALAPEGATLGIVASPRGTAMLERTALAVQAVLAGAPEIAPFRGELEQTLKEMIGTAKPTLAALGLTRDRGFALFVVDTRTVAILPVTDRNKFVAMMHGVKAADGDLVAGHVCKTVKGRYVCAEDRALLARLGTGGAGLIAALASAGARGDLEFASAHFAGPDGPGLAAVAQIDPGAIVVRGSVTGLPPGTAGNFGAPGKPRGDASTAAGFGVVDLTPFFAGQPAGTIGPKVSLAEFAASIAGPLTFVIASGTTNPVIRVPLRDPAPARAVVEHCTELPMFAALGATVNAGACHVALDRSGLVVDARIDGKELRFDDGSARKATTVTPSRLAAELAQGAWSWAFFGRGAFLDPTRVPGMAKDLRRPEDLLRARFFMLCNELGVAMRVDGDALRVVAGIRTAWTNPDDVVRKLLAVSPAQFATGITEVGRAIAEAAPASPFAEDFKADPTGIVIAAPIELFSAIAIPTLMQPRRRP